MNKTLVMIKPDCVQRHMVGVVVTAIESSGLTIAKLQQKTLSKKEASNLYQEHKGKWHFSRNITHVTSGPVVVMQVEGENAVERCRTLVENFRQAHSDVIVLPRNLLHATSDSSRSEREINAVGLN